MDYVVSINGCITVFMWCIWCVCVSVCSKCPREFLYDVNGETVCVFMYNVMRTMFMLFSDT